MSSPQSIVCLASYFKGNDFLRECKSRGCNVILITKQKLSQEDWARESIDELVALPDDATPGTFLYAVTELARRIKIDRLIALEEFDILTAALIREHLQLEGMLTSQARLFRDKLAMRIQSRAAGIPVPRFVHFLRYQDVGEFMEEVPAPWILKPRSVVSAIGIRKLESSEAVWRAMEELDARRSPDERASHYILEKFVAGDVYHVDSLVDDGKVIFAGTNIYGRPPLDVAHAGGIYLSKTLKQSSSDRKRLLELNKKLISQLGLKRGVTHVEFIKCNSDSEFYFLEIAARVGGAFTAEVLEAATGVNLWRMWAALELGDKDVRRGLRPRRREYAGVALSLARQEYPDTSAYIDPEITLRIRKRHHVGLIVSSRDYDRVSELLDQYSRRFAEDFLATLPPLEKVE